LLSGGSFATGAKSIVPARGGSQSCCTAAILASLATDTLLDPAAASSPTGIVR
jgi:hypothetical protein